MDPDRTQAMLEVSAARAAYGSIEALKGVSVRAERGRTTAVLGANGAGKTTLAKVISGLVPLAGGTVSFEGRDLSRASVVARVRLGLMLVPEGRGLIGTLSVEENLLLGAYTRRGSLQADLDAVYELFPTLARIRNRGARLLSGGELQMLAVARATMAKPSLMVLDEPSMGLAPRAVEAVFDALGTLKRSGLSLLVVEQNAAMAFELADMVYVLEVGQNAGQGTPAELLRDESVRRAYLGIA